MKKMTLDLDSLVVESFDTSAGLAGRGTVRGHDTLVEPYQSVGRTACLCPITGFCIDTDDDASCAVTLCNDPSCTCPSVGVSCTCPPPTGATCDEYSCRWTLCDFTCNIHCA
jgi:hypothetical protein